ncbi:Holliday junction branch migration DNA helicase RuvB [Candidatus Dependentiae bacterium]|nr:Holliday junction branch migration DNA helicase RuvB [Candidatus Dependentiae bacterium]
MVVERIISSDSGEQEKQFNWSLRPKSISEYIGQFKVVEKLQVAIQAAKMRNEPLEHTLFYGPPGLGKTTLAHIISNEMGANLVTSSGPILDKKGDLMGILTNLEEKDILFIDEIHRLSIAVEEFIYPAMEDFKTDFVVDKGAFAKTIKIPIKPFTLVGATTRAGLLSAPLRERFGLIHHLDFYPVEELMKIIERSANLLNNKIEKSAIEEIAKRGRGTPRIVNRLLRRVRDYAMVNNGGIIDIYTAVKSLELEGVDSMGLDDLDRAYLKLIIEFYNGGPVGIEAIAATLDEESDTLVDMIEPYLLKIGFISRTRGGRIVNPVAYAHMNIKHPSHQTMLL